MKRIFNSAGPNARCIDLLQYISYPVDYKVFKCLYMSFEKNITACVENGLRRV